MKVVITEFAGIGRTGLGEDLAVQAPANIITSQSIDIGATSLACNTFNAQTRLIRVFAEGDCTIDVGVMPIATATTSIPLAAGADIYLSVTPGFKAAAIERTVA